jgi:hypothetical protein
MKTQYCALDSAIKLSSNSEATAAWPKGLGYALDEHVCNNSLGGRFLWLCNVILPLNAVMQRSGSIETYKL